MNIGEAAKALGVHPETLRRWEKEGKIPAPWRTPGGTRRYDVDQLCQVAPKRVAVSRTTVAYARAASHDQKDDLLRQAERLRSFCTANGWTFDVIQDLGSGMNHRNKGLQDLLGRICAGGVVSSDEAVQQGLRARVGTPDNHPILQLTRNGGIPGDCRDGCQAVLIYQDAP